MASLSTLEWAGLWSVLEQAHSQMPFHSPWSQAVNLSTWLRSQRQEIIGYNTAL